MRMRGRRRCSRRAADPPTAAILAGSRLALPDSVSVSQSGPIHAPSVPDQNPDRSRIGPDARETYLGFPRAPFPPDQLGGLVCPTWENSRKFAMLESIRASVGRKRRQIPDFAP